MSRPKKMSQREWDRQRAAFMEVHGLPETLVRRLEAKGALGALHAQAKLLSYPEGHARHPLRAGTTADI